jgi:hypothetical protein
MTTWRRIPPVDGRARQRIAIILRFLRPILCLLSGAGLQGEVDGGLGRCGRLEKLLCKLEWLVGFGHVRPFVFPQPVAQE